MKQILVAGRTQANLDELEKRIQAMGSFDTVTSVLLNGSADPLRGRNPLPAVLVLVLHGNSTAELEALSARSASERVPLVVIGDKLEPRTMRMAMQAGARDFLSGDSDEAHLAEILHVLLQEASPTRVIQNTRTIALINAAGGNGASTVAINLGCILAAGRPAESTALIDLDLQFAPSAQYLDIAPGRGIVEALERIHEIDDVALTGYLASHRSGLKIMSALTSSELARGDHFARALPELLEQVRKGHQFVLLDVPNQLGVLSIAALEQADQIVIVLQQNLISIRNTARLVEILQRELSVPRSRIVLVINRFTKAATLELADIKNSLQSDPIFMIPNHYRSVAESIDVGEPLALHDAKSPVVRAIKELGEHLLGETKEKTGNFITKTLSSFMRT